MRKLLLCGAAAIGLAAIASPSQSCVPITGQIGGLLHFSCADDPATWYGYSADTIIHGVAASVIATAGMSGRHVSFTVCDKIRCPNGTDTVPCPSLPDVCSNAVNGRVPAVYNVGWVTPY